MRKAMIGLMLVAMVGCGRKLEPVDCTVDLRFERKGDALLLVLTSSERYSSVPRDYVTTTKVTGDVVEIKLLGINGNKHRMQVFGHAGAVIPLAEPPKAFELRLRYRSKRDSYRIEFLNGRFKYRPAKGSFTRIDDSLDGKPGDGIAKMKQH